LIQLRTNNQNELIKKCIALNQTAYPINEENFDTFIYKLSIRKTSIESYSKNKNLYKKAKNIYQIISKENDSQININGNDNKKIILISPEEYIIQNSVPEEVMKNTSIILNYLKFLESVDEKKKKKDKDDNSEEISEDTREYEKDKELLNNRNIVFIPTHEIYGDLEIGRYFGEMAMEQKGSGKRHATLIAAEECYIGAIDIDNYYSLLHSLIENSHHKFIHFISTFFIFQNLSLNVWEKRYITLFINRIYEKDFLLLKEGETIDQIYFTYKGEFEITTNKNLIGVNELIIYYKKIMIKLLSKVKNNSDNKKMKKECDIREEIKENENFIMNKKYHGEQFEKMIFDKKIIKIGLYSSKEIIGLLDLYTDNKDNINKEEDVFRTRKLKMMSLFDCKCLSCNCEVYSFPLSKFKDMCYNEDRVNELTIEFEIQKIKYIIKRLKKYKEFLYENLYKKEYEMIKEIKTIKNKNIKKGLKNKFEPLKEYSNISLKNGIINDNIPIQIYNNKNNYRKKLLNSFTHFININGSYDKNISKSKKISLFSQNSFNTDKKKEGIRLKRKLLLLPVLDNPDTTIKKKKDDNDNDKPRYSSEKKDDKIKIFFQKNEENNN
jgi:CRP-like cAMP-binding protein